MSDALHADQHTRAANALTIDVEDYFQVSAFAPYIRRSAWETTPCRIERNIERVLALLSERWGQGHFLHARMAGAALSRHRARHRVTGP